MTKIVISSKEAPIIREVDVLVVGGGPAGIGAAISASYDGSRVLILEKNGFLGGNITKAYVETCNYFMKDTGFEVSGVFAKMEQGYKEIFGRGDDIRPDSPHRFSSEYLKIFLDKFMAEHNVEVFFHSFVNEVVVENDKITAVIIQTKQGPQAIIAKTIIDCSGDADVAFAAGVEFAIGRDKDNLCQPGTVNFRLAGANAARLLEDGQDKLKEVGRKFREDYRAGTTKLRCLRQDIPFGRLTPGGQITYVNYPCSYKINPTSIEGLTQGETECREYIHEVVGYMRDNMFGMENIELASIAPEIGFRDSRRIKGKYVLTIEDTTTFKEFDDVIAVYPPFYDMLSPDGNMQGDGRLAGGGYKGHIYEAIKGDRAFEIPYRALVPEGIKNLLVAGRSISCDHVAQSGIRAISACTMTGEAAGAAAAMASKNAVGVGDICIRTLQEKLRTQGIAIPKREGSL